MDDQVEDHVSLTYSMTHLRNMSFFEMKYNNNRWKTIRDSHDTGRFVKKGKIVCIFCLLVYAIELTEMKTSDRNYH